MESVKVATGPFLTHLHRAGEGEAVLFIHGSGPGATGLSNWQLALPELGRDFLCLAPDLVGYGESTHPEPPPRGARAWMRLWVDQLLGLLDALGLERAHLVGNSLGGGIALHLLMEAPERFGRVVLMGPAGGPFRQTPELDRIWGFYEDPTLSAMRNAIRWFAFDEGFVRDRLEEIARMRLEAALRPEVRRSFEAMWPRPRQEAIDQLVVPPSALKRMDHPVLILHGYRDGIVPIETSLYLMEHLPNAHLVLLGRTSHWVQIEQAATFHRLVRAFLKGEL
ncbi:alpha/beta fold hydrolase [Thermus thermophilus]|uniref:Putative hydrolase or acyltransferase of alpha/beta superfamily n=1 Tax=Thermus thermophilus JL-18 TaxID=798128 RepID=H9ZV84_THETH|nr:alpha/beta hydrolase [Thermus thermophilus]AFH40244.1 putative hydrolase or acyltransferase of alpha/beta superfamily [Thermus thermophilus JL-18]